MCTLTFSPQRSGFLVVMNRDEQRSRIAALPPTFRQLGDRHALFPSEPTGGTWIGLNDAGVVLALLNWYAVPSRPLAFPISRGAIIPALLSESDPHMAGRSLATLALDRIQPFRLVGIFPTNGERQVHEWRWDGEALIAIEHPWKLEHWISSGADEEGAERERRRCFARHSTAADHGTKEWLIRLHASHEPAPGAASVCVHREDAATVSQTCIGWADGSGWMEYLEGLPCGSGRHPLRLWLGPRA